MPTASVTKTDELLAFFDERGDCTEPTPDLSSRFRCDAGTINRAKARWKERRMSGTVIEISLDTLETELGTQMRPGLNDARVRELKGLRESGITLDPIDVVRTPEGDVVTDGFHRICDLIGSGLDTVMARVRTGTVDDAFLEACKANAVGPLPRDDQTKATAVRTLLEKFDGDTKGVEWLAKHAVVSHYFAEKVRDRWLIERGKGDDPDVRIAADGHEYVSKTTPAERESKRGVPRGTPTPSTNGHANRNGHANGSGPARDPVDDIEAEDRAEAEAERKAKAKDAEEAETAVDLRRKLESCKVREKLSKDRRQVFDIEAENYFAVTGHESFNETIRQVKKILDFKTMGLNGPFHNQLARIARMTHPRDWKACVKCNGTGMGANSTCRDCNGYGYHI